MRKATELVTKPIAIVVLMALLGVSAHAAAIFVFTSRDAFEAFVGPPDFAFNFDGASSLRSSVINFSPVGHWVGDGVVTEGALRILANPAAGARFNVSPGFAVNGWGMDVNPIGGPGQIEFLAGGLSNLINITGPGFVGFASNVPLRAYNFSFVALESLSTDIGLAQTPSTNFVIDNVIINVVPEPTTLFLFATGAGLMGWARHRRVRKVTREAPRPEGTRA